jgi:hypothetical protein
MLDGRTVTIVEDEREQIRGGVLEMHVGEKGNGANNA